MNGNNAGRFHREETAFQGRLTLLPFPFKMYVVQRKSWGFLFKIKSSMLQNMLRFYYIFCISWITKSNNYFYCNASLRSHLDFEVNEDTCSLLNVITQFHVWFDFWACNTNNNSRLITQCKFSNRINKKQKLVIIFLFGKMQ